MNTARKILGERRRKARGAPGVGRWKDTGGCFVVHSGSSVRANWWTSRETQLQHRCSLLTWLFCILGLIHFLHLPSYSKSYRYGEGEQTGNTRAALQQSREMWEGPTAAGDEAESVFSCGSKKAQRALAAWGHLGHDVSGHCREPKGEQRMKPSTFHLVKTPPLWFPFFSTSVPFCDSSLT